MGNQDVPSRYDLSDLFKIFIFKGRKYRDLETLLQNVPASDPIEIQACLKDESIPVHHKQDIFGYLEYGANLFILRYMKGKEVLQISFCNFLL